MLSFRAEVEKVLRQGRQAKTSSPIAVVGDIDARTCLCLSGGNCLFHSLCDARYHSARAALILNAASRIIRTDLQTLHVRRVFLSIFQMIRELQ